LPLPSITTVEMHTGGEPLRIVTGGYPALAGATLLEKRREARERHDRLRRLLMREPRGHAEMYGAVLVPPDDPAADLAVLFLHNEGYSTMCGHAVIALGRYAIDKGLVAAMVPTTQVAIQCPCGLVVATVTVEGSKSGAVSFESVPAFAAALDAPVSVPGYGEVRVDIGYGGAFYAILPAATLGLSLTDNPLGTKLAAAKAVTAALRDHPSIVHPEEPDLSFLYGTILTEAPDAPGPARNLCVFGGGQIDRSPTGSGVTARLAVDHAKGLIGPGDTRDFLSVTGSRFTGAVVRDARCGDRPAVVVRVAGQAHYSGEAVFRLEEDDPFAEGFLLDPPRGLL